MENVLFSNIKKLEKIKKAFLEDGPGKLHVVSDFDKTLTYALVNGQKIPSLISILRDGNYLSADYAEKAHALFNKYHPIEVNPEIPLDEKKKTMLEWWKSHFELLIKSGLNKRDLENVVTSEKIKLRDGALDFIDFLHVHDIPLIIISSSGLGRDAINIYLKRKSKLYNNIYVISNSFYWDKDGNAAAIKQPIIHSFNKDETALKDFPVFQKIKRRKNVLLLGDSLEDTEMVKGFNYKNIIKIGFLNEDTEKNLRLYKKYYDVIILNDSSMNYVNSLLMGIIK